MSVDPLDDLGGDSGGLGDGGVDRVRRRFFEKVVQTPSCWVWTGCPQSGGYGQFDLSPGVRQMAHRFAYELLVGLIPDGLDLDHLCRNRLCVNPAHLEPVTHQENLLRSPIAFAGVNARKTHCKRGHELKGDNLLKNKAGARDCKLCKRQRNKTYYARGR